jgi:hypothetical protein
MKTAAVIPAMMAASLCATAAVAQDAELLREIGVEARGVVIANMTYFQCDGTPCAAATTEELASPPVTDDEAAEIAATAVISAMAEHCGLDWSGQSFLPMMDRWRSRQGGTVRRYALIGGMHGYVQEQALESFRSQGDCDDQIRAAVQAALDQNRD